VMVTFESVLQSVFTLVSMDPQLSRLAAVAEAGRIVRADCCLDKRDLSVMCPWKLMTLDQTVGADPDLAWVKYRGWDADRLVAAMDSAVVRLQTAVRSMLDSEADLWSGAGDGHGGGDLHSASTQHQGDAHATVPQPPAPALGGVCGGGM
jgi:hypothetical protein